MDNYRLNATIGPVQTRSATGGMSQPMALIIDDSLDCQHFACLLLEQLGCQWMLAGTASAGLSLATAWGPDLVLLDIVLPDYSGLELLRRLQQQPQTAATPVIAVTALAQPLDRCRMLAAGCVAYLSKPYLIEDFIQVLDPILASRVGVRAAHSVRHQPG